MTQEAKPIFGGGAREVSGLVEAWWAALVTAGPLELPHSLAGAPPLPQLNRARQPKQKTQPMKQTRGVLRDSASRTTPRGTGSG